MSFYHRVCEIFGFGKDEEFEYETEIQKKFGGLFIVYEEDGEDAENGEEEKVFEEDLIHVAACEEVPLKKYSSVRSIATNYTEELTSDCEDSIDGESEEPRNRQIEIAEQIIF